MVQAAAAEAEPSSDQPVKARVSKRRPKPLREDDWTQLKKAIHEDGTVLQPSSSSDSQAVHQLIEKLIADAEMRKKLPKVLDDKAARRYPPVRLLATTPADQLHCMGALAAASKQVALTLNPRPAAAAADGGSTAEEEPSSSSSSSSSSSDKPRPTRHSTARVAWQPVPVNNPLSGVVDVPVGSILYYATPALIGECSAENGGLQAASRVQLSHTNMHLLHALNAMTMLVPGCARPAVAVHIQRWL
jgi:hypothetical protein